MYSCPHLQYSLTIIWYSLVLILDALLSLSLTTSYSYLWYSLMFLFLFLMLYCHYLILSYHYPWYSLIIISDTFLFLSLVLTYHCSWYSGTNVIYGTNDMLFFHSFSPLLTLSPLSSIKSCLLLSLLHWSSHNFFLNTCSFGAPLIVPNVFRCNSHPISPSVFSSGPQLIFLPLSPVLSLPQFFF